MIDRLAFSDSTVCGGSGAVTSAFRFYWTHKGSSRSFLMSECSFKFFAVCKVVSFFCTAGLKAAMAAADAVFIAGQCEALPAV